MKMAVSNWYLYFGMFLCCSGFLLPLGIFYIVWWFWSRHEDMEKAKFTQNNYSANSDGSGLIILITHHGKQPGKKTHQEILFQKKLWRRTDDEQKKKDRWWIHTRPRGV